MSNKVFNSYVIIHPKLSLGSPCILEFIESNVSVYGSCMVTFQLHLTLVHLSGIRQNGIFK